MFPWQATVSTLLRARYMPDLLAIITGIASAGVAVPMTAWVVLRRIRSSVAADRAERSAMEWHERVIKRQDIENDRLRMEIKALRESVASANKRLLEVELRERIKERVIRDLVEQIKTLQGEHVVPSVTVESLKNL